MKNKIFFFLLASVFGMIQVWGQTTMCLTNTTNWDESGLSNTAGQGCGGNAYVFNGSGDMATSPVINNPSSLSFQRMRSGNSTTWSMEIEISTNAAHTTWTNVATLSSISNSCVSQTVNLSAYTGARKIRFRDTRPSGAHERTISDIEVTCVTAVNRTVTFNGNGNTGGTMANQTASTATNLTNNAFTKTGYTFAGWATSVANATNGTVAYSNQTSYPFSADATLYAVWQFNVAYNNNGGTGTINSQNGYFNSSTGNGSITLNNGAAFTRTDYTFGGWKTTSGDAGTAAYSGGGTYTHSGSSATVTLYAHWIANPTPTVTTTTISGTYPATSSGGNVTNQGATAVTQRGLIWGVSAAALTTLPTLGATNTVGMSSNGTGTGNFTTLMAGIKPGTTVYYRAYATNSSGTSFGSTLSYAVPSYATSLAYWNFGATGGTYTEAATTILTTATLTASGATKDLNGKDGFVYNGAVRGQALTWDDAKVGTSTATFTITLNTTAYETLQFRADYLAQVGGSYTLSYSTDGSSWTDLTTTGSLATRINGDFNWQTIHHTLPSALNNLTNVQLRFTANNVSGGINDELSFDNIEVFGTCLTPATPANSFTASENPSCEPVTLSYDGTAPNGVIYYWQTSASGISTTNPVSTPQTISTTGYRWVRGLSACGTWSTASIQSAQIVINSLPVITTQPADQSVVVGATATFSVTATGTAPLTYKWQQKIGSGSWTNITLNGSSTSYTTPTTTLAMNGYQYRVIITNGCGDVISAVRTLTVIDGPCVTEDFEGMGASVGNYTAPRIWNGDGGQWTATQARTDRTLNGRAICFNGNGVLTSPTFTGGIGNLKFQYRRDFTGTGTRTLKVFVNGIQQGADISVVVSSNTVGNYNVDLNIEGTIAVEIRTSGDQILIDDIEWTCYVNCTPATITSTPTSGPTGTVVTINGSNFSSASTVKFGSISATTTFVSATQIKTMVPTGATTGPITVDTTLDCDSEVPFNVIVQDGSACAGAVNIPNVPSGSGSLIFYEIFDSSTGNSGLITLLNASYQNINLADYQISRDGDGNGPEVEVPAWHLPSGILAPGEVYVFSAGSASQCSQYPAFNGGTPTSTGLNDNDRLRILRADNLAIVDEVVTPSYSGYFLLRNHYAANPVHNNSDWSTTASGACRSGLGTTPISGGNPIQPTISSQPVINYTSCDSANLSISAGVSNSGTPNLSYQWFVNTPGSTNWTPISNVAPYSGATSATLVIASLTGMDQNQYYVQVRQGAGACFTPSIANQLLLSALQTTWNGTGWSNGLPSATKIVRLAANYNTNTGNLTACSLDLNGHTLTINSDQLATIHNNITGTGTINIQDSGSLVQVVDGIANGTGWELNMQRITKKVYRYDFTYWGSPLNSASNFTLKDLSPTTFFDKYYSWDAASQNWVTHNFGETVMVPGTGYIVRAPQSHAIEGSAGAVPQTATTTFTGLPNNGIVPQNVVANSTLNSWNLLSNPYPSAINIEDFLLANSTRLEGTIYLWSHNTRILPSQTNPGAYTYSPNDYATYNFSGAVTTQPAPSDDNPSDDTELNNSTPTAFLAAGQAFFVKALSSGSVSFSNTYRGGANNNFFKPAPTTPIENWEMTGKHRVWLNLTGASAFNQTLVGYIENATNELDWGYDGLHFSGNKVSFYSILETNNLAIQGRSLPFNNQDIVPLGYKSIISGTLKISIDHLDGILENQDIYLEDLVLNVTHNLKDSAYSFTTTVGTFNNRFLLKYTDATLGTENPDALANSVVVYKNENVLGVSSDLELINEVTVYDLLGRVVYQNSNLSENQFSTQNVVLNEQVLIVKVKLENGAVISKKIIY